MFSAFLFAAKLAQALARFSAVILRLPVKLAFADQVLDHWRYEITNGSASCNPVSDIGSGNIDVASDRGIRVLCPQAGAIEHRKLNHFRKVAEAVPRRQLGDVIFAEQENEFGIGLALFQHFDGVDGVGGRGTGEFQFVETKARLALDRGADHLHAQISGRRLLSGLVRRTRGRNEKEAVELQLFQRVAGQDQVPIMNGIEGAAKDADLFQCVKSCFAVRREK